MLAKMGMTECDFHSGTYSGNSFNISAKSSMGRGHKQVASSDDQEFVLQRREARRETEPVLPVTLRRSVLWFLSVLGIDFSAAGWAAMPVAFELDLGQTQEIKVTGPSGTLERSIRLLALREFYWPNSHMNIETIVPHHTNGAAVSAGGLLGRTGMTWAGRKSQHHDPHLHWAVSVDGKPLASYPFAVEAYLRDYADPLLAVAGGYHYATPGETVELDASRSVARPGRRIVRYQRRLHDGREVAGPRATVNAGQPGLFSEELRLLADNGSEDRDYLKAGLYTAALRSRGPADEAVEVRMRVVIAPSVTDTAETSAVKADDFLNSIGVCSAVSRRGENLVWR